MDGPYSSIRLHTSQRSESNCDIAQDLPVGCVDALRAFYAMLLNEPSDHRSFLYWSNSVQLMNEHPTQVILFPFHLLYSVDIYILLSTATRFQSGHTVCNPVDYRECVSPNFNCQIPSSWNSAEKHLCERRRRQQQWKRPARPTIVAHTVTVVSQMIYSRSRLT
jgi:hypothetical protein